MTTADPFLIFFKTFSYFDYILLLVYMWKPINVNNRSNLNRGVILLRSKASSSCVFEVSWMSSRRAVSYYVVTMLQHHGPL